MIIPEKLKPNAFNLALYKPLRRLPNENIIKHYTLEVFSFLAKISRPIYSRALIITSYIATAAPYSFTLMTIAVTSIALRCLLCKDDNTSAVLETVAGIAMAGLMCYAIDVVIETITVLYLLKLCRDKIEDIQAVYQIKAAEDLSSLIDLKRRMKTLKVE